MEGEEPMTKEKLSWLQQKMLNKSIKKKCQNFRELGYSSINEEDLLTYLLTYRWKKQTHLSVKDCRKDIQKVKPNEFFDYQQLLAQTSKKTLRDWHDIEDLF
ncbi:hypothetical protein SOQ27_001566 [Enterococcus faecalis]|uniref:post-transcriptional regulator n=1 Tax=Enterococcus faecalis TaxID=1351 RepID=UPI00076FA0A4|nr:post-transcriptional regulator [Enterococcus faecalis]EHS8008738.1 hypothetical protein [Enterococcus faecalis]ELY8228714.1 hypothetical protein [Enterococcus faecalis]